MLNSEISWTLISPVAGHRSAEGASRDSDLPSRNPTLEPCSGGKSAVPRAPGRLRATVFKAALQSPMQGKFSMMEAPLLPFPQEIHKHIWKARTLTPMWSLLRK